MIKFEKTEVYNIANAVYSARNPLNSWTKSDSDLENNILGPKDIELCQKLIKGGPEHRKFLRQIIVSVDITAPLYWWKEFDTYKVGTVANSCSTMHTIHKKEFSREDFSTEKLMCGFVSDETGEWCEQNFWDVTMNHIIEALNIARYHYIKTKDKQYWYAMIQLLPTSYNQKRTITMNYENIRSMYFQRRNHKLDEWREGFVEWAKSLPYADELIIFDPVYEEEKKILLDSEKLSKALMPAT